MKEEKKVTTSKKTNTTKKQGTKTSSAKKTTTVKKNTTTKNNSAKKTTPVKKATPTKTTTAKKSTSTKTTSTKKNTTTKSSIKPVSKPVEKKVKVNYEPRETKIQENIEFPEYKFNSENVTKEVIFSDSEKENINEVVEYLKENKENEKEKDLVRSTVKRNAIIVLVVLMAAIILLTIGYTIKTNKKPKDSALETLNSNVYEKILENTKERDERLNNKKDNEEETENPKNEEKPEDYSNIRTISLEEFEEKVLNHESMVILISSSTCYYCNQYEPIVNEELTIQDKNIYRFNVRAITKEEADILQSYYNFKITPTLFYVNENGIVTDELVGYQGKEVFSEWMSNK